MNLSRQRQGELFILGESLLWSLFPIITFLSFTNLSPLVSLVLSSFFSFFFFFALIVKKNLWHEIGNKKAFLDIFIMTLILGVGYYLLVFIGLQYTSPGNASIIALTQIFFSFLFFHVFRREHIPTPHIIGGFLMVCGALIVLASSFKAFHIGDLLILLANAMAPFGNFFSQRARKQVTSETIMFVRTTVSTLILFLIALAMQTPISLPAISNALPLLLINGIFLLGLSKILWIEGIHRISVTKALSQASIEPLLTLIFAFLILQQLPTIWQLTAVVPIIIGVLLLGKQTTKSQITPAQD